MKQMKELGINPTQKDLETMAEKAAIAAGGEGGSAMVLKEADMLRIYEGAMGA